MPVRPMILMTVLALAAAPAAAQEVPWRTGSWDPDTLGNHRAVVWVREPATVVRVRIPWRRRDLHPEQVETIVLDAATGRRITNVLRVAINREYGDFVFEPLYAPAEYHFYYLPHNSTGHRNYPQIEYTATRETADTAWIARRMLTPEALASDRWERIPQAAVTEIQAVDDFDSFSPMEIIATAQETRALVAAYPDAPYLLFPENRRFSIRMNHDLPYRWIERGPFRAFQGDADKGEFYVFQVGVWAVRDLDRLEVHASDFRHERANATIPASAVSVFNLGGVDSKGHDFTIPLSVPKGAVQPLWLGIAVPEDAISGRYTGTVTVVAGGFPPRPIPVTITVSDRTIRAHGDDEPWRMSRLRWLDSRIALDDELVRPFTAVAVQGRNVRVLGREVTLGDDGLPVRIKSFFATEMTGLTDRARDVLTGPIRIVAENTDGRELPWQPAALRFVDLHAGVAQWEVTNQAGPLAMRLHGSMDFDGTMEYTVALTSNASIDLRDIRLEIPIREDVARYMMGMEQRGGLRPDSLEWRWRVERNQDGAWIGDVNAGLQFSMRDEHYERPLNTNFYLSKPLVMPRSWANDGKGGCRLGVEGNAFVVRCYSGARTMTAGDTLRYDFRLVVTPFKPIDTDAQWRTRFFHRYAPLDSIRALGANVVNVHHATPINPYINYPFLTPDTMKAYVDAAHARGMKVKIYYTLRELTNRAPELFALFSLGHEVLSSGPGGGAPWLQEHLNGDYIAGWYVPDLKDAAVVNSGVSRWHNFYLEGLDWLTRNIGIDGLYIDDVAFDRVTMKRVRKILDRNRPNALIDLHSANQFNTRDGFANSANLYLEHFPYINRLWFGEYFDYNSRPDYWLVELSGIPFGLMGEMLQDGGNPWRGMLYGMTSRLPWAGDPSPLWKQWDAFGMEGSRMIGYWVPDSPVQTGNDDVLATAFVRDGKTMVALASWAPDTVRVNLAIDWRALGLVRDKVRITAPAIRDFQESRTFANARGIPVAPGKGWLLVIQ